MTFWLAESGTHSGGTNVWLTPRWVLDLFGPFDLDPAGHPGWTTAAHHFYEQDNGLYQDWWGLVWCNPPYGVQTADWVQRWAQHPNGLLLVANRSDTMWWQEAAKASDALWFPKGRIHFLNPEGKAAKGTAFASIVMGRGEGANRIQRAAHLGMVITNHKS